MSKKSNVFETEHNLRRVPTMPTGPAARWRLLFFIISVPIVIVAFIVLLSFTSYLWYF
jgi:hypothetical protein